MKLVSILLIILWSSIAAAQTVVCPTTTGSPFTIGGPWKCVQGTFTNPGTTSWSKAYGSNVTSGNLLVVEFFEYLNSANLTSVSVSGSLNGAFTCEPFTNSSPNIQYDGLCFKVATSSGAETISFTPTCSGGCVIHSGGSGGGEVIEFSDSSGTPTFDTNFTNATGASAGGTCPCAFTSITATTAAANELVILAIDTGSGAPQGPNYIQLNSSTINWATSEASWIGNASSSGSQTGSGSDTTANDTYVFMGIAFKPTNAIASAHRMTLVGVGP